MTAWTSERNPHGDVRYLAALTAIVASGVAAGTQVSAAAVYTVVALAFAEVRLASHLAGPRTDARASRVHAWLKARGRGFAGVLSSPCWGFS